MIFVYKCSATTYNRLFRTESSLPTHRRIEVFPGPPGTRGKLFSEGGSSMGTAALFQTMTRGFDLAQAIAEADRCLLCHDPPCSKGCPAETDPGTFIRKLRLHNVTGAIRTIKSNNILGGACGVLCPTPRLCEKECSATGHQPSRGNRQDPARPGRAWVEDRLPAADGTRENPGKGRGHRVRTRRAFLCCRAGTGRLRRHDFRGAFRTGRCHPLRGTGVPVRHGVLRARACRSPAPGGRDRLRNSY